MIGFAIRSPRSAVRGPDLVYEANEPNEPRTAGRGLRPATNVY
jgi:hypothetical protein